VASLHERRAKQTAYQAAYRAAHRQEKAVYDVAYRAAYRAAHRKESAIYNAAYYAAHREEHAAYDAAHREERQAHYARMRPMVYAWFDANGICEYVGRGTAPRASSHKRRPWWTSTHVLLTMTCDSEWQAMEYEGIWGARYQPRQNKEGYRHSGV
jgi:hypothetical protein